VHPTIERLRDAINAHDPSAMTALLAPEYVSEQPAHPNRGFSGRDQVDKNWSLLFTGVPDLAVEVSAAVDDGATSFSEWEFRGHHQDGSVFHERGIMLLRLRDDGLIASARMYFELVEEGGADIDETMRRTAKVDS
jgi:ketosteroid isomerase-like protein